MSRHDRARGWVYLSTLCNQGVDGCYEPDCLCRCHDKDRLPPAAESRPSTDAEGGRQ